MHKSTYRWPAGILAAVLVTSALPSHAAEDHGITPQVDLLLLRPNDNVPFAQKDTINSGTPQGDTANVDPGFALGYRIGLGYNLPGSNGTDIKASFGYF